jgi:hypothetical protein
LFCTLAESLRDEIYIRDEDYDFKAKSLNDAGDHRILVQILMEATEPKLIKPQILLQPKQSSLF